jgi:hypothetical protein
MKKFILAVVAMVGLMGCNSLNRILGFTDSHPNPPVIQRQIAGTVAGDLRVPLVAFAPMYRITRVEVAPASNPMAFVAKAWRQRMTGSSAYAGYITFDAVPGDLYRITVTGPQE